MDMLPLIDVYTLANCVEVRTSAVFDVLESKSSVVGEFRELFTRCIDVEHAYDKLKGVEGKPQFEDVYSYLAAFVRPFAQRNTTPRVWNSGKQSWDDLSRMVDKRPLQADEQEAREHPAYKPNKTIHEDDFEI